MKSDGTAVLKNFKSAWCEAQKAVGGRCRKRMTEQRLYAASAGLRLTGMKRLRTDRLTPIRLERHGQCEDPPCSEAYRGERRQTALVKSAANTNTARANAERVRAAQEAKFCNSCNHPIYSCAWRVPSHARPGNLVRSGTKQPYWCACSAEDKARHFRTCKRRSEDPGPDSISVHWGILHSR